MIPACRIDTLPTPGRYAGRWAVPRGMAAMLAIAVVIASPWLLAGWASMLVNCAAIFLALKHCVWLAAPSATVAASAAERIAFYMFWPGFDAAAFLDRRRMQTSPPTIADWLAAAAKTLLAGAILWTLVPRLGGADPLAVGLAGMLSGVLLIHCGLFHFVALGWQTAGRPVTPIMNQPLAAVSLADFWSRRWNLAFRDAAALVLFRPLARRFNTGTATLITYFLSGLWHEAVISLPARGGYGLPTLYFLLQGVGMVLQRRTLRRRPGLPAATARRVTTALVIVLPLPLLFHRPFAEHVIVPFLHVLGVL